MDSDADTKRNATRDEYEVAYFTKELGRPLQRKMLQQRLSEFATHAPSSALASHGEDATHEVQQAPPKDDRAG